MAFANCRQVANYLGSSSVSILTEGFFLPFDYLHEIVVGVGGQCVTPGVESQGGSPGQAQLKVDEPRLHLVELNVPVAVGRKLLHQPVAQRDLVEGGAVWRKIPRLLFVCHRLFKH